VHLLAFRVHPIFTAVKFTAIDRSSSISAQYTTGITNNRSEICGPANILEANPS
jgi:hypothetical protein